MTTRTRARGGDSRGVVVRQTFNPSGVMDSNATHLSTLPSQCASSDAESITDVVTKDFKKLRSQGNVIMSPVTITRRRCVTSPKTYNSPVIPGWGRLYFSGDVMAWWAANAADPATFATRNTEAAAWTLQEAYSKVAQEDFMAYVTVAEAGKTASMIAKPLARTEALLRKVLSRKATLVARGLNVGSAAASAWLEYRLGWKPLLYDLEGMFDAYIANTQSFDKPTRLVARRSFKHQYVLEGDPYTASAPFLGGGPPMLRNKVLNAKISSGVLYELWDETLADATARRMGVRLADVPASIWELVPYSFVVDRFVSVGSWLNAIMPKPGVTVKGSWTTTVTQSELECFSKDYSLSINGTWITIPGGDSSSDTTVKIQRTANPSTALFAVPQWNPKSISLHQTLDHMALLFELFRGIGLTRK